MASKSGLLLNLRVSSMYKYRGDYVKTFGTSKTVSEMMSVLCDYTEGCSATLVNLTAAESGSLSLLDVTSSEGPVLSVGANMVTAQLEGGIVTVDLLTKHVTWAVSKENYERRSSGTCPR